ncbi:MAG: hypothetical protein COA54_04450 [Thiotrichaceae bacterium]|nr:MAG: hypothetical protein COA54_04450 [Thiotrichaceae bacterium]
MPNNKPTLLSIIELGGYPDFSSIYEAAGFEVLKTDKVRKAVKLIRQHKPTVWLHKNTIIDISMVLHIIPE